MYKCVVFDVDGTLIDTRDANNYSLQKLLLDFTGKEYDAEELAFTFSMPSEAVLNHFNIEINNSILEKWNYLFNNEFGSKIKVFDGIKTVINGLSSKGKYLGIITSRLRYEFQTAEKLVASCGNFETIVTADDVKNRKPHAEPLIYFMKETGFAKENIIYIGDSIDDVTCAANAGVTSGLVRWSGADTANIKADYYFDTPEDILKIV